MITTINNILSIHSKLHQKLQNNHVKVSHNGFVYISKKTRVNVYYMIAYKAIN